MGKYDFRVKYLTNLKQTLNKDFPNQNLISEKESLNNLINVFNNANNPLVDNKILYHNPGTMKYSSSEVWFNKMIDNVNKTNAKGDDSITSVSEAFSKLMSIVHVEGLNPQSIFFRGQANEEWPLNSSLYRMKYSPSQLEKFKDSCIFTRIEKKNIEKFIKDTRKIKLCGNSERKEILGKYTKLPKKNSPEWWPIMQHYSDYGTRFIDITSSFLVALYFSVAKWEPKGEDEVFHCDKNGKLFVIPNSYKIYSFENKTLYDVLDKDDFRKDFMRTALPFARPAKQESYFLVDYDIKKDYEFSNSYIFIVDKDYKRSILNELNVLGINKERIQQGWT